MRFLIYDATGKLRFQSRNWPMAREAMNLVISEAGEPASPEECPRLIIGPDWSDTKAGSD